MPVTPADDALGLRPHLEVLRRRARVVLAVVLGAVSIAIAGSLLWPPTYRATAKILVERVDDPEKAVLFGVYSSRGFERHDWIRSEVEIIGSYPVAARVVRSFGLHLRWQPHRGWDPRRLWARSEGTPPPFPDGAPAGAFDPDPHRFELDEHTVALYHFDEDLRDAGPHGCHLWVEGDAAVTPDGAGGGVLRARRPGDEAVARIPDRLLAGAWQGPRTLSLEARVYPRGYGAQDAGADAILALDRNDGTRLVLIDGTGRPALDPQGNPGPARVATGAWHDLRVTLDATGTAAVYLDGAPLGRRQVPQELPVDGGGTANWLLRLGNFDGDIDEVRVSNTVRGAPAPGAPVAAGPSAAAPGRLFEKAVAEFLSSGLAVDKAVNSNVIEVSYDDRDPLLAARVANGVIDTYMAYRAELYTNSQARALFDRQIDEVEARLSELEDRQMRFKQQESLLSAESQREILVTRLADFERTLTDTRIKRIGKQTRLDVIRVHLGQIEDLTLPATELSDMLGSGTYIAKLREKLLDLEVQRESLAQRYTSGYQEVANLDSQIAAARLKLREERDRILSEEQESVHVLQAQEDALDASVDLLEREVRDFARKEAELAHITRGLDETRNVYSLLLKQREEARLSRDELERGIEIRVISPAAVPLEPLWPRKRLNVAAAAVFGLAAGVGLAYLLEFLVPVAVSRRSQEWSQQDLASGAQPAAGTGRRSGLAIRSE